MRHAQQIASERSRRARRCTAVLVVGLLTGACNDGGGSPSAGSNTNWLKTCDATADCGGDLECVCGVCTVACVTDASCAGHDDAAMCIATDDTKLADVCTSADADKARRVCVRTCAKDADCEGDETCEDRLCTGAPAETGGAGGSGGNGGTSGSGGSGGSSGAGGAGAGGSGGASGAGGTMSTPTEGCAVSIQDTADVCSGAGCPVTLNALIECASGVYDLRAAAAGSDRGYVAFTQQAPATPRGYAMFALIKAGGGSEVEQQPDDVWRLDVAADMKGAPVLFGVTDSGIARFDGGVGSWKRTTIDGGTDARFRVDGALATDDSAYALYGAPDESLLLADDTGGSWTNREITGPLANCATLGLCYYDAFALALAPDGTPHVAHWRRDASEARLVAIAGVGGSPETVFTQPPSQAGSPFQLLAPDAEAGPSLTRPGTSDIELLVPDGSGGYAALAVATRVSVTPTGCMEQQTEGDCPADTTYTEKSDGAQFMGHALARTADGTAWIAYAARHVECDYQRKQTVNESGPQCASSVTDDRSRTEIVIAEVTTGTSAALTERFRGPIDNRDIPAVAMDASGSHLHVATAATRTLGESDHGSVRYLVIDTAKF